ncbi:MAG: exodeoxyribonuclease VII large subunit [Deltaproteobacteria bacterium]|nr:exodeoxyribonuclease VII large subunit [Deltaproteobacteria bacterium]TLN04524.1 MAG: exodeoxyribonuclease VII large subunit [bacterium]
MFTEKRILSVSKLTSLIREVIEENFEHVWVEGEVSNLAVPASGHLYFTLKDAGAQIRCVLFRASSRILKFKVQNGMALVLRGRVSVYDQRGEYQFIAEYLEPKGIGALQLAFVQLKEKLAREGLFDESRKKPLPGLPRRIGVVTSASGAAIHDILTVLRRRHAGVEVLICPVTVQGEGAAAEISAAIRDFNRYREVDVLIVGRGGGSMEDLWAFNEEQVARAIFASRIPVISAIGHEVDYTIADFVADLRAPTPSAAAELVVKSRQELDAQLSNLSHRLSLAMEHSLEGARDRTEGLLAALKDPALWIGHLMQRIDELSDRAARALRGKVSLSQERFVWLSHRLQIRSPALEVERFRERLLIASDRMAGAMRHKIENVREKNAVNAARLSVLSPLATLERGYSITRSRADGLIVRSSDQLEKGDSVTVAFRHGSANCIVETVQGES